MKIYILSFLLLFITASYGFSDTLVYKKKKLEFMIEAGSGFNLNTRFDKIDSIQYLRSANRKKFNIGLFYHIDREWKISTTLEYYSINVRQTILLRDYRYSKYIKHKLKALKVNPVLYHCVIHDDKSTIYLGLGFSLNRYLYPESKTSATSVKIDDEKENAQLTTYTPQKLFMSVEVGLLYEYRFNYFDFGYKFGFATYGPQSLNYKYDITNTANYTGTYIPNGYNLESSIFFKF